MSDPIMATDIAAMPEPAPPQPAPEAAIEFLVNGGDMVMIAHHLDVADATYDAIKGAVLSGRLPRARRTASASSAAATPSPSLSTGMMIESFDMTMILAELVHAFCRRRHDELSADVGQR